MGDPNRKAELFDALAQTGKALSNGKRLELLDLLAQGERSVDALAKAAGLPADFERMRWFPLPPVCLAPGEDPSGF